MNDAPLRGSNNGSHRGKSSMKLLGARRGDGLLLWDGGEAPVSYRLDLYESRNQRTASGTLDGDLAIIAEDAADVRLRLDDGFELEIALSGLDPDGADFEARGALPG